MNKSYNQIRCALAKMLPELLVFSSYTPYGGDGSYKCQELIWLHKGQRAGPVIESELLHVCWIIERTLSNADRATYHKRLEQLIGGVLADALCHAEWWQRAIALAQIKGVTI